MNVREVYKDFLNQAVDIGIPHLYREGKLFFISGIVIDIEGDFLVLKIKDGIRRIPFGDIVEIRGSRGADDVT